LSTWRRVTPAVAVLAGLLVGGCSATYSNPGYPALQPTPTSLVAPSPTAAGVASNAAAASAATPAPTASGVTGSPSVSSVVVASAAANGAWQVTFEKPVVSAGSAAAAGAMNAAIGKAVNAYIADFTTHAPETSAPGHPSTLNGSFTIALSSPTLLSLRFAVTEATSGTAGAETLAGSVNFVASSGTSIALGDLFTNAAAALPVLSAQVRTQLAGRLGGALIWPASPTMDSFGAFDLTVAGLELTWSQGVVAPPADGTASVLVPWPALAAVIAPAGPAGEFIA
jgi:hypothetical protein